jgi:zinc protease
VIRGAGSQRLRAFYRDWYRPERMALVAVGDIDADAALAAIKSSFGDIPKSADLRPLPLYEIPRHAETLVAVATDPEARESSVSVIFKHPAAGRDGRDYRHDLMESLFDSMVNDRLSEVARRSDAPFLDASSSGDALGQTVDTHALWARVADGGIEAGLRALVTEAERVRRHGFAPAELERAKKSMRAGYERGFLERDKTESQSYAREYVSHFLDAEPSPGIETEYRLVEQFLPGISLDEVRA